MEEGGISGERGGGKKEGGGMIYKSLSNIKLQ
jgi:hypothetical protein